MSSKSSLVTLKDHLDLRSEYEPYSLPNRNAFTAKDNGKDHKSQISPSSTIFCVIVYSLPPISLYVSSSCPASSQSDWLIIRQDSAILPKGFSCFSNLPLPYLTWGGGAKYAPLLFFLHHPKTAQGIKLKLSNFKDTPLRHILQVKPVH